MLINYMHICVYASTVLSIEHYNKSSNLGNYITYHTEKAISANDFKS
jgi:hypothetical protein